MNTADFSPYIETGAAQLPDDEVVFIGNLTQGDTVDEVNLPAETFGARVLPGTHDIVVHGYRTGSVPDDIGFVRYDFAPGKIYSIRFGHKRSLGIFAGRGEFTLIEFPAEDVVADFRMCHSDEKRTCNERLHMFADLRHHLEPGQTVESLDAVVAVSYAPSLRNYRYTRSARRFWSGKEVPVGEYPVGEYCAEALDKQMSALARQVILPDRDASDSRDHDYTLQLALVEFIFDSFGVAVPGEGLKKGGRSQVFIKIRVELAARDSAETLQWTILGVGEDDHYGLLSLADTRFYGALDRAIEDLAEQLAITLEKQIAQ